MTLEDFTAVVYVLWSAVPSPLLRELSGGLVVSAAVRELPGPGNLVALGEYQADIGGRRVVLYYGSFQRALGESGDCAWRERIDSTIRHEVRHHIESLAGCADLIREDEKLIAGWQGG